MSLILILYNMVPYRSRFNTVRIRALSQLLYTRSDRHAVVGKVTRNLPGKRATSLRAAALVYLHDIVSISLVIHVVYSRN